jgi:hypothetical protein
LGEVQFTANRTGDAMATPIENLSETESPYTPRDNSSITVAVRGLRLFFSMWGDPQRDGSMRPGDWLVLLIGMALFIGSGLVVLRGF